jgi:hypothetical protein
VKFEEFIVNFGQEERVEMVLSFFFVTTMLEKESKAKFPVKELVLTEIFVTESETSRIFITEPEVPRMFEKEHPEIENWPEKDFILNRLLAVFVEMSASYIFHKFVLEYGVDVKLLFNAKAKYPLLSDGQVFMVLLVAFSAETLFKVTIAFIFSKESKR